MHLSWKRTIDDPNHRNKWSKWVEDAPKMVAEIEKAWSKFLGALDEPDKSNFDDAYRREKEALAV